MIGRGGSAPLNSPDRLNLDVSNYVQDDTICGVIPEKFNAYILCIMSIHYHVIRLLLDWNT